MVRDLLPQLEGLDIPFEILIGNDCSDSKFIPIFSSLDQLKGVRCFHAEENLGRSKIRNTMARQAQYPYLLFIDGDAMIQSETFIADYLENAEPGKVICGGTAYTNEIPEKREEELRWKYGVVREARSAKERGIRPFSGFSSFNFFIPTEVFKTIGFNEAILRYGHEDTIFGIELERQGVPMQHIDNQLIHTGLDSAELFLKKTREALLNLTELLESYEYPESLISHIRLLNRYMKFRKWGIHHVLWLINNVAGRSIYRKLLGSAPSLTLFDLYKLCILHKNQA